MQGRVSGLVQCSVSLSRNPSQALQQAASLELKKAVVGAAAPSKSLLSDEQAVEGWLPEICKTAGTLAL